MSTAQARAVHEKTGFKVVFGDPKTKRTHWSEVFENNPHIVQLPKNEQCTAFWIENYPGKRPYVLGGHDRHFIWNPLHRAVPGELYFSRPEMAWRDSRGLPDKYVVMEPNIKGKVSGKNKDWGWSRWQEFVDQWGGEKIIQVGTEESPRLNGVDFVETPTFRHACLVLSKAVHFYGTDGGLHHAAAALDVPATVIWGDYSPPEILGYPQHTNLGGGWCGALDDCEHCRKAMEDIDLL